MNIRMLKFTFTALLLLCFTLGASAQKKSISKADKEAIIKIFEDVDPSKYKLVFNNGKETYGKKRIKMGDLKKLSQKTTPASRGIKWTLIAGDRSENEVFYIYTEGESLMASMLGKKKLKALQRIASKYDDIKLDR